MPIPRLGNGSRGLLPIDPRHSNARLATECRSGVFLCTSMMSSNAMHQLTLPYPPSVNTYWRHVGPRVLISKHGRQYRTDVCKQLRRRGVEPIEGDLIVDIVINPPDRRRRDVDNVLKALLDSLQFGGAFEDDSQIVRLSIEKHEPRPKEGRATVRIQALPPNIDLSDARICLRCNYVFDSEGPHNRICEDCTVINRDLPEGPPILRGLKRHNGRVIR